MARGQEELLSGHLTPRVPVRNYTRKYMFKFWKIEKRRRAIIMRESMARRTLIRTNPKYGPFRSIDIHECSSDSDDEPTISVAPAASDVPTAAPGRSSQAVARIDRALDVLNAPGSFRQEFQAYFNPRNLGPGDLEEFGKNSDLMEQLMSMICTCKVWQMKRPKVLNQTLIDPQTCRSCRHTQNHSVRSGSSEPLTTQGYHNRTSGYER